jgi:antitoxin MazE
MHTRVETYPGGIAVVIPGPLAEQVGLCAGRLAEIEVSGGRLVVRTTGPETLADLLAGIPPDNLHSEWAAGPPAGAELL